MKLTKLNTSIRISVLGTPATAVAVLLLVLCQSAVAQDIQPRPVARLLGPVVDAGYARPRRATEESVSTATNEANSSASLAEANAIERRAFEQTNRARVENGLLPLAWDNELFRLARLHSERMAVQHFFSHETLEGLQLKDRARARQIRFRVIGENIAYNKGYDDPGGFAVERWMISSGHRANILHAGFQASAIGSYVSADGSTYLTQVFITR